MAKTNISMPDALLDEVDRRAADAHTTRSGFIQEAAAHYIAALDADRAADERAQRIAHALGEMEEIGRELPAGRDSALLLRTLRDAPPRWLLEGEPYE